MPRRNGDRYVLVKRLIDGPHRAARPASSLGDARAMLKALMERGERGWQIYDTSGTGRSKPVMPPTTTTAGAQHWTVSMRESLQDRSPCKIASRGPALRWSGLGLPQEGISDSKPGAGPSG
jgi:hypothetical protein